MYALVKKHNNIARLSQNCSKYGNHNRFCYEIQNNKIYKITQYCETITILFKS